MANTKKRKSILKSSTSCDSINAGIPRCNFYVECFDLFNPFTDLLTTQPRLVDIADPISAYITLFVGRRSRGSSEVEWVLHSQTETIQDTLNPQFSTKMTLLDNEIEVDSTVLFKVSALHPTNNWPVCIGSAECTVQELLSNDDIVIKKLREGQTQKGHLMVYLFKKNLTKKLTELALKTRESFSIERILQLPTNMEYRECFSQYFGIHHRQKYVFPQRGTGSHTLAVTETMFELSISFSLPALFIRMLYDAEHQNLLILQTIEGAARPEELRELMRGCQEKMAGYMRDLHIMGKVSKQDSFKKSELKGKAEYKWAPINLHSQILEVTNPKEDAGIQRYHVLTVGAMAAHWEKFKGGGLHSNPAFSGVFAQHQRLYLLLLKILEIERANNANNKEKRSIKDDVGVLLSLSAEEDAKAALEEMQHSLVKEKQLEIVNIIANLLRKVHSMKIKSEENVGDIAEQYCHYVKQAIVWHLAKFKDPVWSRYEPCFSQLVTTCVSAFLSSLSYLSNNKIFLEQLAALRLPVMFESLLSTHGDESAMLEDMWGVLQHINSIKIKVELGDSEQCCVTSLQGNLYHVVVVVSVPDIVHSVLPQSLQQGGLLTFVPLFFSHGINEQQTVAYAMGETILQDSICTVFLESLASYFAEFRLLEACSESRASVIESNIEELSKLFLLTKKSKCADFIVLSEKIGRSLGCVRVTSCKSAKDRTSMSVTYEYCQILRELHDISQNSITTALDEFRRNGTRYYNTFKNIGSYKYCFNALQCRTLPSIYKPPQGTYGDGAAQT